MQRHRTTTTSLHAATNLLFLLCALAYTHTHHVAAPRGVKARRTQVGRTCGFVYVFTHICIII